MLNATVKRYLKYVITVAGIAVCTFAVIVLYESNLLHIGKSDTVYENGIASRAVPLKPFVYTPLADSCLLFVDQAMRRFMRNEWLKGGAQIAISYKGNVFYSSAIGYSDMEDSIPMKVSNRMRIASCSKLITAVAIMRLVEEGRLTLGSHVFGPVGILNDDEYLSFRDPRMGNITVCQLLNHSGGWSQRWGDPMFMPHSIARQTGMKLPVSMSTIIRFMQTKRLHFTPGKGCEYCNFGYGILGEVVAKASGMPYEEYVKRYVLSPLGIKDMQLGYSYKSERLPDEVLYYEADSAYCALDYTTDSSYVMVRRAYGGTDIHTLGSAGGWIASASSLLKVLLTIDGFDTVPDQLSEQSIFDMTEHDPFFDPLGWRRTRPDGTWHRTGTLAATSAIMSRRPDGFAYVVVLNSANHRGPFLAQMLSWCMDDLIARIDTTQQYIKADALQADVVWQGWKKSHRNDFNVKR